jgi:hypothetical protein
MFCSLLWEFGHFLCFSASLKITRGPHMSLETHCSRSFPFLPLPPGVGVSHHFDLQVLTTEALQVFYLDLCALTTKGLLVFHLDPWFLPKPHFQQAGGAFPSHLSCR